MSNVTFIDFKNAVESQVNLMAKSRVLYQTTQEQDLRDVYLESFPEGTNPIYRERRVYDANYDLTFIKQFGGVVAIVDGKRVSVWDIEVGGYYQSVIEALRKVVHESQIDVPFYHFKDSVGVMDHNFELLANGETKRWDHFFAQLPFKFVKHEDEIPSELSRLRSHHQVLKRSLEEISLASAEIVLELIDNNSLYRGDEMRHRVTTFIHLKNQYDSLSSEDLKTQFLWSTVLEYGGEVRIRNSAIGTLLVDLSDGMELEDAVASFEDKISEGKYKRSSAVVTQGMIKEAKKTIVALGLEDALYRRYARLDDLTINNVLFANRDARKAMDPFDMIAEETPVKNGKVSGSGQEISITDFMEKIVSGAKNIEVLVENKHINNLFSLIAPEHASAGNMLKWDNNFSWSYRGEVTDSIREKVKKAGGNVNGVLRCSLSWNNIDDLDIHVLQPNGETICYHNKRSRTGGMLDIDMNMGGRLSEEPVENVYWNSKPLEGIYEVLVNNYTKRCNDAKKDGFQVEIDDNGTSTMFGSNKNPRGGQTVTVVRFKYSHASGVEILTGDGVQNTRSETVWGITTNTFQKVNMIMNSPNHWDGNCTGNKHLFFSLANCRNEEESRGFYNEFLRDELQPHRKSFEVLGSKLKTPKSDDQVSGLGFSSTKRNDATFKVDGRLFKVLF